MLMIKGVIFDLDGVICSTDHYHYLAWKAIADELKIPFDEKVNEKLRGVSRMESLDIILSNANVDFSEDEKLYYATKKNELYKLYLKQMDKSDLSESTKNVLLELKKRNVKIAIGSSSKNTMLILNRLGIENIFDIIVDGNDIKNSKPDPEVFIKAQEKLGLNANECIVVEDADSGIIAANRAHILVAGIGNHYTYAVPDYRISNLQEILKII